MRKLLLALALAAFVTLFAASRPASAGPGEMPGYEGPPPCETCSDGDTTTWSGVVWVFTSGIWTVFTG